MYTACAACATQTRTRCSTHHSPEVRASFRKAAAGAARGSGIRLGGGTPRRRPAGPPHPNRDATTTARPRQEPAGAPPPASRVRCRRGTASSSTSPATLRIRPRVASPRALAATCTAQNRGPGRLGDIAAVTVPTAGQFGVPPPNARRGDVAAAGPFDVALGPVETLELLPFMLLV